MITSRRVITQHQMLYRQVRVCFFHVMAQLITAILAASHVDVRSEHRNASVNYGLHQLTSSTSQPEHLPPPPVATYYPSTSYLEPSSPNDQFYDASPSTVVRRPSDMLRDIANYSHAGEPDGMEDVEYWEDEEEGEESFVNFSLLSHLAVQLKDKVPRGTHVKGSIPYPRAFTGKDIVVSYLLFL